MCVHICEGQRIILGTIPQALCISFCIFVCFGLVWFCEIESFIGLELN